MVVQALEFGVLGLSAITLVYVWRVINVEQARPGSPRKGILQACYVLMAFCLLLAILNGYVQLSTSGADGSAAELQAEVAQLRGRLTSLHDLARPLLVARSEIVDSLPPGPQRDALQALVQSLDGLVGTTGIQ